MMMNNKNAVYMFAGFLMAAYFKLDLTAISLFAIVIALILRELKFGSKGKAYASTEGPEVTIESDDIDILDTPDGF